MALQGYRQKGDRVVTASRKEYRKVILNMFVGGRESQMGSGPE